MKFILFFGLVFCAGFARAECSNSANPSCSVYEQCFAKYCKCPAGPTEYFLSYGQKYCKSFLQNENFGSAGTKWRETTLRCLQESIVPKLDLNNSQCDCAEMKDFAYKSHVSCYTLPSASICQLPLGDLNEIRKTIEVKDTLTSDGWKQMHEVAKICVTTAPDDGRRALWRAFEYVLKKR